MDYNKHVKNNISCILKAKYIYESSELIQSFFFNNCIPLQHGPCTTSQLTSHAGIFIISNRDEPTVEKFIR